MADAERLLVSILRDGDVLLTLGAGDVDRLAERLVTGPPVEPAGSRAA
jgi:UDP-N-acetylmuramate-alanine ligase